MPKPSLIADISGFDSTLREMALLDIRIAEANVRRSDEILEAEARFTAAAGLLVGTEFIRTKEEVDKQGLKTSRRTEEELANLGVKIHQKETFFVEPRAPKSTTSEAAA